MNVMGIFCFIGSMSGLVLGKKFNEYGFLFGDLKTQMSRKRSMNVERGRFSR